MLLGGDGQPSPAPTNHPIWFGDDANVITENDTYTMPLASPSQSPPQQPPPIITPIVPPPTTGTAVPPNVYPSDVTNLNAIGSTVERPSMITGTIFFRKIFLRSDGTGGVAGSSSNNKNTADTDSSSNSSGDSNPFNNIVRPGGDTTTLSSDGGTNSNAASSSFFRIPIA